MIGEENTYSGPQEYWTRKHAREVLEGLGATEASIIQCLKEKENLMPQMVYAKHSDGGDIKWCNQCQGVRHTSCSACGCGNCQTCGYRWVCNPVQNLDPIPLNSIFITSQEEYDKRLQEQMDQLKKSWGYEDNEPDTWVSPKGKTAKTFRFISKDEVKCIVCSKKIKRLHSELEPTPPEVDSWDGAGVHDFYVGYGSSHDTKRFIVAICDSCIDSKLADGSLTHAKISN